MVQLGGFWSYAHDDDTADFGRITDLGRDIVAQFEMLTGESIELFVDRDSLEWGHLWRERVDQALGSVAFFCPVVTPRYFQSAECRRELSAFAERAESLGLTGLIMPILYVDFPALHDDSGSDEHIVLVKKYQWEDWTSLRFEDRGSGTYRREVTAMADRVVSANRAAELHAGLDSVSLVSVPGIAGGDPPDGAETPGVIDLIADMEQTIPIWTATTERIGNIIVDVGEVTSAAAAEMNLPAVQAKGFAGRVNVSRRLAQVLDPQGDEIIGLGNEFASNLNSIDLGVRALLELATPEDGTTQEDYEELFSFFDSIVSLSQVSRESLASIDTMLESMAPVEKMSRDLRPVLRKYRQGLTAMTVGVSVSDEWVRLIEANPLYQAREAATRAD
jgi:hypothetical protein